MKQTIRLTESELKDMVMRAINENMEEGFMNNAKTAFSNAAKNMGGQANQGQNFYQQGGQANQGQKAFQQQGQGQNNNYVQTLQQISKLVQGLIQQLQQQTQQKGNW